MNNWKSSIYIVLTAANIYNSLYTHHRNKKHEKALKSLLVDAKTGAIDFKTIEDFTIDEILTRLGSKK